MAADCLSLFVRHFVDVGKLQKLLKNSKLREQNEEE